MLFCVFDAIYGIVDLVWVSKIGVEAFFAMGISIPIVSLIFSFGDSIGQGTNSIMSRFIGSGDYESAYNALIHGVILANIVWTFIVFLLLFAQGILFYVDKADKYILVFDYLVPIVIFAYVFIFTNFFSETLQAEGNSRTPTILIITSNVLNIILDPIFIFNFNLGLKGAAYATVISGWGAFMVFLFLYLTGRTKVPLSLKYFKFRLYILVEIFKVALPNFLDNGLWAFSASFINSILIMTTGEIGPILYSVVNKMKSLLIAPVRGYGRALMSVTGHLFGAGEFDDLNGMYKYTLKVSFITMTILMLVFIFIREYAFSLFSITGMSDEIFWIAISGTVMMLAIPFSMISSKMLDGFGKSLYSLLFTFIKIMFEVTIIYGLSVLMNDGNCVLVGLLITEVTFATIYYLFLRYLFKNFAETYEGKETVKNFKDESDEENVLTDSGEIRYRGMRVKVELIVALIALSVLLLEILYLLFRLQKPYLMLPGAIAFIIGGISVYLIQKFEKPKLSALGFFVNAVLIFVFMGKEGILPAFLFVAAGITTIYIRLIIRALKIVYNKVT